MEEDESFGIIPLSHKSGAWEVFLVQHKHGKYWGFPKGHAEGRETAQQTAIRELKEETNLDVLQFLQIEPLMEHYRFTLGPRRVSKRVSYFIAEVEGEIKLQVNEIQKGLWISFPEAIEQATHPEAKLILGQVEKFLKNLPPF